MVSGGVIGKYICIAFLGLVATACSLLILGALIYGMDDAESEEYGEDTGIDDMLGGCCCLSIVALPVSIVGIFRLGKQALKDGG